MPQKFELRLRPGHQDQESCAGHYTELDGERLNDRPFYVNGKRTRVICYNTEKWVCIDIDNLAKVQKGEIPAPFEGLVEGRGNGEIKDTAWNLYTVEITVLENLAGKMLYLTLVDAELTHDTETFGKMDPFVKITSEHLGLKSSIHKKGGKTPAWNQVLTIDPTYLGHEVKISVMDDEGEDGKKADLVGDITVLKEDLMTEQETDKWLPLTFGAKKKPAGKLHIRTELKSNNANAFLLRAAQHLADKNVVKVEQKSAEEEQRELSKQLAKEEMMNMFRDHMVLGKSSSTVVPGPVGATPPGMQPLGQ
jgi:hypothetical protein